MAKEHVLVVEDEEDILELVQYNLYKAGYEVKGVDSGEKALSEIASSRPDLVVLDLMLPGVDGLEVCRRIKQDPATRHVPVVMLTARGEESDIIHGLEAGGDDYVTKPFSPKVLVARVKAVLRRKSREATSSSEIVRIHDLAIHPGRHEAILNGEPLDLTLTEFRVLHLLAQSPGWVFTRYQIVDQVHGEGYPVTDRSVDVQIAGLRKKLGAASDYIETVRGVGYRFKE